MAPRGRSTTLAIDLVANDKGASKAIAAQRVEVQGLGDELTKTAELLGGGYVAYQGFQGLEDAAKAASSLTETQNTANQVFRESDAVVREFARNAADSYGQSEKAALSYANVFGAILNNMGLTREESAQTSVELLKLASDLAAAWDTDVPDALAAIQSGLSGQTESMRRYGVELTHVALKEDARNLGYSTTIETLDRRQRAEVVLASIMRQTTDQQGQFNREIEGYNQQQQIATANAENAKAAFGEGLVPIFTKLQQGIAAVSDAYAALPPGVQNATSIVAASGVAVLGVTSAVGLLGPAVKSGASQIANLARAMANLSTTAGLAGGAVGGAALVFTIWSQGAEFAKARSDELEASMRSMAETAAQTGEDIDSVWRKNILLDWANTDRGTGVIQSLGLNLNELSEKLMAGDAEWDAYYNRVTKGVGGYAPFALQGLRGSLEGTREAAARYTETKKALGIAEEGATGAIEDGTEAGKEQLSIIEQLNKATDQRLSKIEAQWTAQERMKRASDELADAREDEAEALRAANGDSDEYRSALDAVADAQESLADSHKGVAEAQERVNEARAAAADRLEELRRRVDELRQSEERANLTTRQAQQAARDALADPTLTKLEKEDAQLKARETAEAERDLKQERSDAARELAEAQRRGIDGDKDVIAAKEGVAEAEDRVREAVDRVRDAQQRASEVIQAAKERVKEASERVRDATLDEAKAWGDLIGAQSGATAGVLAHIDALKAHLATIEEGSPLAKAIQARIDDMLALGTLAALTQGIAAGGIADRATGLPGVFGDAARLYQATQGGGAQVSVYQQFQGTPAEQRAAMASAAKAAFDRIAMGAG